MSEISDIQVRYKASELILRGRNIEDAGLNEEMRRRVRELLTTIVGKSQAQNEPTEGMTAKSPGTVEFIKKFKMEAQYATRLVDTLKHFGFLTEECEAKEGDIKPPSFEKAMNAFQPEEFEIARCYKRPVLLIVPETSFASKVGAIDSHSTKWNSNETCVDDIYKTSDIGSRSITGYRVCIVDGSRATTLYEGDNPQLEFEDRISNRKAARRPGEKGMDRHIYAMLMMEALKKGNPIDPLDIFTLLDDDSSLSESVIPIAGYDPHNYVVFFGFSTLYPPINEYARFRSRVGGDVLLV